jgi:hypothetical protein
VGWVIHRSEITSDDWQITYDATERRTGCLHMHITRERGTGRDGDLGAGAGCTRQYGGRTQGRGAKWNTFLSVDSGRGHITVGRSGKLGTMARRFGSGRSQTLVAQ